MLIHAKLIPIAVLLVANFAKTIAEDDQNGKLNDETEIPKLIDDDHRPSYHSSLKYSSRIMGSRYASNRPVFGIRTFPTLSKKNLTDGVNEGKKAIIATTTEKVLDFRIDYGRNDLRERNKKDDDDGDGGDDEEYLDADDLAKASAGGGKQKKEVEDDEEKTLAQQVADGKYGLIQNELFANGSKRPGILSYKSNNEVPKDTKDNLGGLEKDEIWLAEDHILVLRGGNYQNMKDNESPPPPVWPPIDNFIAPKRQVKIPKNPEIPPPFPVQLTEDGPVEFIKGQNNPSFLPPVLPPIPSFMNDPNKTIPLPFTVVPIPPVPDINNKSLPFPVPPHLLPPFLSNLPPGATFVPPPGNNTEIDEDDPSIYYPPKYDFYYPLDNSTAVPPGPLVPGIILPPPPDFFSLWKPEKPIDGQNETDDSINSVTSNALPGSKYQSHSRKPGRTRLNGNHEKRPVTNATASNNDSEEYEKLEKPKVTYVYPENFKTKLITTTTPLYNTLRTSNKVFTTKYPKGFNSPIFVPNDAHPNVYHPLPTTSPKPNHITLPPTTKSLPKHILIVTTPQSTSKKNIDNSYGKIKPVKTDLDAIRPEIHPLRSLIKPNVTVSYNGKYGHLPPPVNFQPVKSEMDVTPIRGHYVTQPPLTKGSKVPSTDVNSITVTPIPIVKKVRIQQTTGEKPDTSVISPNPTKATLYFYEETPAKENKAPRVQATEKPQELVTPHISTVETAKEEIKPVTPSYYYTGHSTSKTPIRQFLEETFHSSNVLTRKPQIAQVNNAEIITHNGYSDIPKMKHLNYGTPISSPRPVVKYHYVTDGNTVVIPAPKIKELEIKNSGSSGLQTVRLEPVSVRPLPPKPLHIEAYVDQPKNPEEHQQAPISHAVTPNPIEYNTADGPFIPSNYYATVRPEHIHFTSQEQTFVDDITKNYFTIFGQKINSQSTTPLAPANNNNNNPGPVKTKSKQQESGLSYISEDGSNFKIQQVHDNSGKKPGKSSSSFYTREKTKSPQPTRPPSNFEKYLKELTGEDQRDYIITGIFPVKIKKGKGFTGDGIPTHILQQPPIILQNGAVLAPPQLPYQPNLSTTLRPVADVEIKAQYIQQIPSTGKPYIIQQTVQPIQAQSIPFSPQFQQYLRELTGLTSPTTKRPVKVKKPNLEYLPNPGPPAPYKAPDVRQKPISLADDYLVNFKPPRPSVETAAEVVDVSGHIPYDNIKIVDSPDLTRNPNLPYSPIKNIPFDVFFRNLPKPEFFSQNGGNSFVSYNLPGNGGHFFFLTPQIAEKENEPENRGREKPFKRVNRSGEPGRGFSSEEIIRQSGQIEKIHGGGYSSTDYLRRRRKKP